MTIAISVKVNDGVVLAADSASTMVGKDPSGKTVVMNIYENANKVFNLHKEIPVGCITWGAGSIGSASISTLMKDFRKIISNQNDSYKGWKVDTNNYNIKNIAEKFKEFIYDRNYIQEYLKWKEKPIIGFIIAGYSSGKGMAEEYKINIDNKGNCFGPDLLRDKNICGLSWNGEPEAITRLYFGYSTGLPNILKECSLDAKKIKEIMEKCNKKLVAPMVFPPMPIQDAIDLARFLVETTKHFSRFIPGASTVSGETEIAAITKHEGYKWVNRKFYYLPKFNQKEV